MAEPTLDRLLDAFATITAERGLEQATMREVAAAAGVSVGTVQYYCRTKDEMLLLAFKHIIDRITTRAAGVEHTGPVGSVLKQIVLEFLPLDELRQRESRVYLAFAARAAVTPALTGYQHSLLADLRDQCARAYVLAKERGESVTDFDPVLASIQTAALVDGLVLQLLSDPDGLSITSAVEAVDAHLRRYVDLG
ncbi:MULTISPECIES: TetR/AcrR family transcriptional regulator [Kribbella]|uniref:TetR/AcrR family transcriptional regulator n=1 Tax=Kribbella karoonensis TaxID=324851 RepID=A0ABP4PRE0_9ACTN